MTHQGSEGGIDTSIVMQLVEAHEELSFTGIAIQYVIQHLCCRRDMSLGSFCYGESSLAPLVVADVGCRQHIIEVDDAER